VKCDRITRNGESGELYLEAGNMMKKVNSGEAI